MTYRDRRLRPDVSSSEHLGYLVTVVDGEHILASAATRRVDLLRPDAFPAPVRDAAVSVTRHEDTFRLDASARVGPESRIGVNALGGDPLSALLGRRAAAGDRWAVKIVSGMGVVAAEVSRRLSPAEPALSDTRVAERVDGATGLRATVTYRSADKPEAREVALHADVPGTDMTAAHLAAMGRLLVEAVDEIAGRAGSGRITLSAAVADERFVTLDQVGGLDPAVARLRQIAVSFRHPDAMARWGARRPQGLLLYGPPGTGKTMLARALAQEIGARFEEIHTPDILDKWLGASERNIKRIFQEARRYREPTVMLFDEFDSIIGYAGDASDGASQAINAVAGIFKQEMNDLIEVNPRVIVVATTNFPDRVDASLIRSGRFDVKILVAAPDETGRSEILAKMIRHLIAAYESGDFRMFADDVDVDALAAASHGLTGADLAEVLRRAQLAKAMQEARTGSDAPAITQDDLRHQIAELRVELVSGKR